MVGPPIWGVGGEPGLGFLSGSDLSIGTADAPPAKTSAMTPAFRVTLGLIAAFAAVAVALLPFAKLPGPEMPGINGVFSAVVFVAEISIGFLLFVRFRQQPVRSLLLLGCAYFFSALMAVLYVLTFPGALMTGRPVLGTAASVSWIFVIWIFGFASLVLIAVAMATGTERPIAANGAARALAAAIASVIVCVFGIALIAIFFTGQLPPMIGRTGFTALSEVPTYLAAAMLALAVALILLRPALHNELYLWLALSLSVLALANVISNAGGGRYTLGWTACRVSWMVSACALFLYFMEQFVRQQRQLGRARDVLEQRVAERTADLTGMIDQRDLLLREVHHRVKNNFQVVNSLIRLQSAHAKDAETKTVLADLHRRVYALGLVHQQLMQSNNLATFDVRAFLYDLSANLAAWPATERRGIKVTAEADPIAADLDFAGPLTLLINELVDGALKRPLPDGHAGHIAIALRKRSADTVVLTVSDNAEIAPVEPEEPESRIMTALVKQLKGELTTARDGETVITVVMPHPKVRVGLG
jgi:two-component sensor histidine kinase